MLVTTFTYDSCSNPSKLNVAGSSTIRHFITFIFRILESSFILKMESSKERTAKWRAMQTNFDKKMIREKDRADKAMKRAMMTEEEKQRVRQKDRIRKALKRGVPSVKKRLQICLWPK